MCVFASRLHGSARPRRGYEKETERGLHFVGASSSFFVAKKRKGGLSDSRLLHHED